MRTPLAWLNLTHQKTRTLVAVAGVAFAIILTFMQLGFRDAIEGTATLVYDRLDFDILLASSEYLHIQEPGTFPRVRLAQARGVTGVKSVAPFYIGFNRWRNPDEPMPEGYRYGRMRRPMLILGIRPTDKVFKLAPEDVRDGLVDEVNAHQHLLKKLDTVLMDRRSRFEFFGENLHIGDTTEIGLRRIEIGDWFTMGTGFGGDGSIIVSDDTFARIIGGRSLDRITLGLIKVAPGYDPEAVARELGRRLPEDVSVVTRPQMERWEKSHWVEHTSIGTIFGLGLIVAFSVGIIFVYQVISSDISSHLHEYATLKAIGYGERYLSSVVLQQAIMLAVLAYVPGLIVAEVLYRLTKASTNLPMQMTIGKMTLVLVLTLLMCSLSGLLSIQKIRSADPADLF